MKPSPFEYHDPATLETAVELLGSLENARILAGGQSLMPMMNFRYVAPDHIIDVNKIGELSGLSLHGSRLRIGATTRQREIEFSGVVAELSPLFQAGLKHVGHRQTRNRGTIGGSLAHADPAAELPNVCAALDAWIELDGPRGARLVPFCEFSAGFMATAVAADEILVAVNVDCWREGHGYAFQEYAKRHGDFAVIGVAVLLDAAADGAISRAAVSICGASVAPVRLGALEHALIGARLDADEIETLSQMAGEIEMLGDHHASAGYRQHLARILTGRALRDARDRIRPPQ